MISSCVLSKFHLQFSANISLQSSLIIWNLFKVSESTVSYGSLRVNKYLPMLQLLSLAVKASLTVSFVAFISYCTLLFLKQKSFTYTYYMLFSNNTGISNGLNDLLNDWSRYMPDAHRTLSFRKSRARFVWCIPVFPAPRMVLVSSFLFWHIGDDIC